jgi:carnitine O-acetyltransferase
VRTPERDRRPHDVATATFADEDRLPRVPLPTLEASCERFLAWCEPLLTAEQLLATKTAVAAFLRPNSRAHLLQAALEEYDASPGVHSWLDAFWSDRYLGRRDRIALNANFFYLFKESNLGQVERAAGLVAAAVDYKKWLDAERIPPVVERGRLASMEQNRFLFSTTRIPGEDVDTVRTPYSADWPGASRHRHIVVFFRGHIFRLEVIGAHGSAHTVDDLAAGLRALIADPAARSRARVSIGHLTAKPRADWAASRRSLLDRYPRNAEPLDEIETALFCLCLEETAPDNVVEACDQLLHGDSANRWFDKSLSLIVFADGTAGINVEHSCLDGLTIVHFIDALLAQSDDDRPGATGAPAQGTPTVASIEFEIDGELQADVTAAADSFRAAAADTATAVLSLDDFGAHRAKQLQISPDAFAQMAFQLAHKRTKGFVGATYESVSTRHFHHGRTEAMRVVTPEVVRLVNTMDDPSADDAARRTALLAAAERHVQLTKECQAGQAPEQHLWELLLAERRRTAGLDASERLALYDSPGWLTMRDDYLSTSSTPSTSVEYGGFGPTSSHCIGIGYLLLADRTNLHLSAPRTASDDLRVFVARLQDASSELQAVLAGGRSDARPG